MNKYETKDLPTIKLTSKSGEYDLCEHDYNLLVATGMLWELFQMLQMFSLLPTK